MEGEIKILKDECCNDLLRFQSDDSYLSYYSDDEYPKEILEELSYSTNYIIDPGIKLSPVASNDVYSSIDIFESLKDLDRVQANDRRLWVGLTHGRFFTYIKERWINDQKSPDILRRFHYEGTSLEARMRNGISRLWWAAKITYDESRADPYELTKLLWSKQDLIQNLVERSYGTYENIIKGFLELYAVNLHLSEDELRSLYTGLNAVGGVKLLSALTKDDVKKELIRIANYKEFELVENR